MESLATFSATLQDQGVSAEEIARQYLHKVLSSTNPQQYLLPLVYTQVSDLYRTRARTLERQVPSYKGLRPPTPKQRQSQGVREDLASLAEETIFIPDPELPGDSRAGRHYLWAECTADMLERRASFLHVQVDGMLETIRRLEEAAQSVRDSKVTYFGQVVYGKEWTPTESSVLV
jgi:hypothetical protein